MNLDHNIAGYTIHIDESKVIGATKKGGKLENMIDSEEGKYLINMGFSENESLMLS